MDALTAARSDAFLRFVETAEPRLRRALVASFGPALGREAAVDALSWAWEHWQRVQLLRNPIGYLYRVGQTAARRALAVRAVPVDETGAAADVPDSLVDLEAALPKLSEQQRAVVVLVHGYAMSYRETAEILAISVMTVREHLRRGMNRLRLELEES